MHWRLTGWLAIGFGCAMVLAGCSKSDSKIKKVETSNADSAQQALETVLSARKEGQAGSGKLNVGGVAIEVKDPNWNSRQKLKAYEVHAEEWQSGARWFTVKLTLPKGEQSAKYAVVGNDPIWVYSEEAFRKLSSWGDDPLNPPAPPPVRKKGR